MTWQPMRKARFEAEAVREIAAKVGLRDAGSNAVLGQNFVAVYRNDKYQCVVETYGDWTWLKIVRLDREPVHDWRDLQRVKNDVAGPEAEAVEVYPAESRLVDESNQYHLFVLPAGQRMPLGYVDRSVRDEPFGLNKNRPFDDPPRDLNAARKLTCDVFTGPTADSRASGR